MNVAVLLQSFLFPIFLKKGTQLSVFHRHVNFLTNQQQLDEKFLSGLSITCVRSGPEWFFFFFLTSHGSLYCRREGRRWCVHQVVFSGRTWNTQRMGWIDFFQVLNGKLGPKVCRVVRKLSAKWNTGKDRKTIIYSLPQICCQILNLDVISTQDWKLSNIENFWRSSCAEGKSLFVRNRWPKDCENIFSQFFWSSISYKNKGSDSVNTYWWLFILNESRELTH